VLSLPSERVVLELDAELVRAPGALELINELRHAGYTIALDHFRFSAELEPLLAAVKIVKLDMLELGPRG